MNNMPIIQSLPLADIKPTQYQQNPNFNFVDRIVNRFDAAKLGTLLVSFRDGNYYILDGVHRLAALRKLGYTHANCLVLATTNLEQEVNCYLQKCEGVKIMNPEKNRRIESVCLSECTPTDYQRPTSDKEVAKIAANYDEAKLGVITVSFRDGEYHIIDGLHRAKALILLGVQHTLAVVLTGRTYEQEAELFRRLNKDKRGITTFDDFNAALEAKDEMCVKINEIVKAHGYQIGRGNSFYRLASVKALCDIADDYGYDVLGDTLSLLAATWSNISRASVAAFLLGVAEFVSRYGKVDFAERMKDKYAVVCYEYGEAMKFKTSNTALARKKFCRVLVFNYNNGINGNSKKRLVWEEG